jgi:thiamine pyrophosphokinase
MSVLPAHRAVILTNGNLADPQRARCHVRSGDRLICADAGARHAIAMGLIPDVVVGDLDSLDAEQREYLVTAGVRFEIHSKDKDKTDLELALRLAIAEGATDIVLLATQGGRLDQSLANLLLLTCPEWATVPVRIVEDGQTAWVLHSEGHCKVVGSIGDTLSLVPLTPTVTGVRLRGVTWPLHDAVLYLGDTLTISNSLTEPEAHVEIGMGMVLIVHRARAGRVDFCRKPAIIACN